MANATQLSAVTAAPAEAAAPRSARSLGYLIVCVVPALFWTLLAAFGGWLFGFEISPSSLVTTGAGICAFLAVVFSALILPARTD